MIELFRQFIFFLLRLFGRIENHTKPPELDGGSPDEVVKSLPPPEAELDPEVLAEAEKTLPDWSKRWLGLQEASAKQNVESPWDIVEEILERPFKSPLDRIPTSRAEIYTIYGRAPKEEKNLEYPKAILKVHEGLPGKWNNNKPRLYMEKSAGEHFREGLKRAQEMEERISALLKAEHAVISYLTSVGSYSHRHIRHNPENDLSFHSWAIAFDQNAGWNRGVSYSPSWQKRVKKGGQFVWEDCKPFEAQRGPVHRVLPYSKQFFEMYPKALPYELVMAFKSVHFCWGGDWGRTGWHAVVKKFGPGYDQFADEVKNSPEYKAAWTEWQSMRYYDAMHFELYLRGDWAKKRWTRLNKMVAS